MNITQMKLSENNTIVFDGVCNLCNSVVQFVIKRDKLNKFKFATLQSQKGQEVLKMTGLSPTHFESFILIMDDKYYLKSTASLILLKELGGVWKLFYYLIYIPLPIRDFFYNIIANSRYKIFGKRNNCMIPANDVKHKFYE